MAVKSADRVIQIFEAVGAVKYGITHSELVTVLGIPKSSLTMLLSNLVDHDYLQYDKLNKRYMLGWRLLALTGRLLSNLDIVSAGRPIIRELVSQIDEDVELAILKGTEILFVSKEECFQPLKYSVEIGDSAPAYATAGGKAILANLPENEISNYVKKARFVPTTNNTITSPDTLKKELEAVRAKGLAYSHEEYQKGICAIAAPIFDFRGTVSGSILVTMPTVRFDDKKKKSIEPKLLAASLSISRQLGFDPDGRDEQDMKQDTDEKC